jgi:hypothetical protein
MKTAIRSFTLPVLLILLAASAPQPGCAAIQKNLPTVLAYVQDGMLVLDEIARFAPIVFAAHPNPKLEAEVNAALAKARASLDTALRIAQGTADINQAQLDAAFAEFKQAYLDVTGLLGPYGLSVQGTALVARSGPTPSLVVPEPLALVGR